MTRRCSDPGFTVIELLTVIVIIALLAVTTAVTYRGVQDRAKDAVRVQDAATISKALQSYNARNGNYPNEQSASWEDSYAYPITFISALVTSDTINAVPVDKVNTLSGGYYRYYRYTAGSYSCDASKGDFYVFQIIKPGGGQSPQSPGFSCSGRNWASEAWYTMGGYQL